MFSVLIRYKKTRREVLIPARSVEFVPKGSDDEPGLLINHAVVAEGGCHLGMTAEGDENYRDVFVMNPQGQTVARYSL
jgi:hypothetical protein